MNYILIKLQDGNRQVGPILDFEEAARNVAALWLEGYTDVSLWVPATAEESQEVVVRAQEIVRETHG